MTSKVVANAAEVPGSSQVEKLDKQAAEIGAGKLLTSREAAALLAVPELQLVTWRCRSPLVLPFVKVGRHVRYRREDIERFVADNLCEA